MDLDELQTVKSRERQTDSLQQLRDSFYTEASEYIQQLREARDRAAERADDPWNDPEVGRLSDEIETAEQTVESIHKRRVAKIVKNASLAAHGSPVDDGGLTAEEQEMFEQLVADIEANREHVLDKIAGEVPVDADPSAGQSDATTEQPGAEPSPVENPGQPSPAQSGGQPSSVESGSRPPHDEDAGRGAGDDASAGEQALAAADVMNDGGSARASEPGPPSGSDGSAPEPAGGSETPSGGDPRPTGDTDAQRVDRRTVRITADIGAILGVDQREYDLSTDDIVTLPEANAEPLLERDAAQPLD
ncbi:DNA replication complex subunit Gins51 [Halapricum desulfuricans]|uniref:DNA replication initiation complex subunit, GINS15 family n=1 Tax=Halapricum desulfuricans TaxID=2841257 RepID=A0A897N7L8_9EURY|nr:hypothetical protein [Halapricum desulfuricans]QSG08707.1 DNA replication initiation complex subunit, GINS15 family [Halapricum desulfuricans]